MYLALSKEGLKMLNEPGHREIWIQSFLSKNLERENKS